MSGNGSSVEFGRQMEALDPTSLHSLNVHGGRRRRTLRGGVGEEEERRAPTGGGAVEVGGE